MTFLKTIFAIITTAFVILTADNPAYSQQSNKMVRLGFLGQGTPNLYVARIKAFKKELGRRGYIEGQNIVFEFRYAEGKPELLPSLATELVRLKVRIIVATGTASSLAVKKISSTIPIVMHAGNPVRTGLVASLARPGGNVTGMTVIPGPDFYGKRLELLKETVPSARQIAFLWNPDNAAHPSSVKALKAAAQQLGVSLLSLSAANTIGIDLALVKIKTVRPDGLLNLGDGLFNTHRKRIVEVVADSGIPAIYTNPRFVRAGGLMSYGPNFIDLYRRMAIYADKILKGAEPGNLPVERPNKFDLLVNLKAAKSLGISVPPSILLRANKVIE